MGIFEEVKAYPPGLSTNARRAYAGMDVSNPATLAVVRAAGALRQTVECPCGRGEAVAHVGLPKAKVAIWIATKGGCSVPDALTRRKDQWQREGWRFYILNRTTAAVTPPETLKAHLKELLE